jgi:hypothetical protein
MKRAERARRWAQHIEGWKASGLTQRAYCERESISYDTFKRWRLRVRGERSRRAAPTRFVPMRVGTASRARALPPESTRESGRGAAGRGVEIRLASARSIILGGEFDEVALARLIRLLEVLPC